MKYQITYFDNKAQAILIKKFRNWDSAYKWGMKNLTKFNSDIIRLIEKDKT